jgi:hypothetical protein
MPQLQAFWAEQYHEIEVEAPVVFARACEMSAVRRPRLLPR